jgi:hypothetical protein
MPINHKQPDKTPPETPTIPVMDKAFIESLKRVVNLNLYGIRDFLRDALKG